MASEVTDLQKIALDKFGKQSALEMKIAVRTKKVSNYKKSAVNASGNLDRSITYAILPNGLEIYANEYVYYVIYGRKPGRQPPYQVIRDWIDDKGIQPDSGNTDKDKDSFAWAIVKSMAKKGTTIYRTFGGVDNGLFSEIFDTESLVQLQDDLVDASMVEYESNLDKKLNNSKILQT